MIMGAGRRCGDWEHAQAPDRPRSIVANHANDVTASAGRDTPETRVMLVCSLQRLERADGELNPAGVAYARAQINAIAQAQKTGDLPAYFDPGFLLGLVLHLATGWVSVSPEFEAAIDVPDPEERARHVENAIRTLLSQRAPA